MSEYTPTTEETMANEIATVRHGQSVTASDLAHRLMPWLAAHDAEVLRNAADALDATTRNLNPANPNELPYINCTRIDAQELRHCAARIERGER